MIFCLWIDASLRGRSFLKVVRRAFVFIALGLLGLISVFAVPAHSTQPEGQRIEEVQPNRTTSLLQQGIALYEAEQFSEAAEIWQQAITDFAAQDDSLSQALTLHYLSLAYQQLGQLPQAETSIVNSVTLLQTIPPETPGFHAIEAKVLNTQGRLFWVQGKLEDALETWQQATLAYQTAGDDTGVILGLLNQASALQSLGFSLQAEDQLQQVVEILEQQSDPALRAAGRRQLGQVLRQIGELTRSRQVLQTSLQEIENTIPSEIQSTTLLELGNTERALANRSIAIGRTENATTHTEQALSFYQQASRSTASPSLQVQAALNQLSLHIERQQWAAAMALTSDIERAIDTLPLNRSTLYAQLNFARSLMQLRQAAIGSVPATHLSALPQIAQRLATTVQQARTLNDVIVESYALGQLGELYEISQQWQAAQELTQQAWLKAEAVQLASLRYRWEWQLGRLRTKQGDKQGALASYQAAVKSLQSIRNDLLQTSTDIQFSFRDDVEPVYRELIELLLTSEQGQPSQDNLRQAIQQVDAIQLAELENFLGCNLAQRVIISEVRADPTAAKLYPIILQDRLALVLELPDQPLQYQEGLQSQPEVEHLLQQLRRYLSESDRTPDAIAGLQQVYQWLIQPFELTLQENSQIQTLVFVLDGELRNIPMAALFDGENYLIRNYAVALAPRLELFQPSSRSPQLQVFLGGVGEPQTVNDRAFSEIAYLTPELNAIEQLVDANPPLLNEAFTQTNLEQQLNRERVSVIHLKTHGVFSSDPEETFIVAYQDLITSQELGHLIRTRRLGEASPIELLVLSACSTAQGDDRAVLGLAGIAVQSGARSAISTLWEAQDVPNTQLMIQFYQELLNPDLTKAQALRLAQLHLIEQGYTTPHIWATYVLVGNWL